jgi:hypothetical protein
MSLQRNVRTSLVARVAEAPRWQPAVAVIAALGALLRLACWLRPYDALDRAYVPDDTYYTLTIARSLAHGEGPTVDGTTLTSGFQALQGFLLVPVFWVVDGARTAAHLNLGLMFLADTVLIVALGWLGYRLAGTVGAVVAAALWAASPLALAMAAGGLETSLAMAMEATLLVAWVWAHDRPSRGRWVAVGLLAGMAILARVDAVLLVALVGVLTLWRGDRRALLTWVPVALLTLAPWWVWCWVNLGTPIPTSGEAAGALAPYDPFDPQMLAIVAGSIAGGPLGSLDGTRTWLLAHAGAATRWYWAALAGLVATAAWWLRPARSPEADPLPRLAAAALAGFGLGLCAFYAWYGLPWFAYRYVAPVAMTVTLAVAALAAGAASWLRAGVEARSAEGPAPRPVRARAAVAVPLLGLVAVAVGATVWRGVEFVQVDRPERFMGDADTGEYEPAERALAHVPDGERVGGWQSGALGYVADGRVTVVNLDGVVNPDAAEARADGTMPEYVDDQRLEYLVDWAPFLIEYEVERLQAGLPIDRQVAEVKTDGKDMSVFVMCCRDGTASTEELEELRATAPELMERD